MNIEVPDTIKRKKRKYYPLPPGKFILKCSWGLEIYKSE